MGVDAGGRGRGCRGRRVELRNALVSERGEAFIELLDRIVSLALNVCNGMKIFEAANIEDIAEASVDTFYRRFWGLQETQFRR